MLISFRKQWKKATVAERIGLDTLQAEKKQRLTKFDRAEHLRKQQMRKECTSTTTRSGLAFLTARRVGASGAPEDSLL